jgi:hypothetical protein
MIVLQSSALALRPCPSGTFENSQQHARVIYGWVPSSQSNQSPAGTAEILFHLARPKNMASATAPARSSFCLNLCFLCDSVAKTTILPNEPKLKITKHYKSIGCVKNGLASFPKRTHFPGSLRFKRFHSTPRNLLQPYTRVFGEKKIVYFYCGMALLRKLSGSAPCLSYPMTTHRTNPNHKSTPAYRKSTVDLGLEQLIRGNNGLQIPFFPVCWRPFSSITTREGEHANQKQTNPDRKIDPFPTLFVNGNRFDSVTISDILL